MWKDEGADTWNFFSGSQKQSYFFGANNSSSTHPEIFVNIPLNGATKLHISGVYYTNHTNTVNGRYNVTSSNGQAISSRYVYGLKDGISTQIGNINVTSSEQIYDVSGYDSVNLYVSCYISGSNPTGYGVSLYNVYTD